MKKQNFGKLFVSVILLLIVIYFVGDVVITKIAADRYNHTISTVFDGATDFRDDPVKEGYRFFWDHSMGPAAFITVFMDGEQPKLNCKIAARPILEEDDITKEPESRELIYEKEIELTDEQLQELRTTVSRNQFWKESVSKDFGLDGANWTIEIKLPNQYHRDTQWSPETGSIRNIGLCLVKMCPDDMKSKELKKMIE